MGRPKGSKNKNRSFNVLKKTFTPEEILEMSEEEERNIL